MPGDFDRLDEDPARASFEIRFSVSSEQACVCRSRALGLPPSVHTGDQDLDAAFLFAGHSPRAIALLDDENRRRLLVLARMPGARIELVIGPRSRLDFRADRLSDDERLEVRAHLDALIERVERLAPLEIEVALAQIWRETEQPSVRAWVQRLLIHKFAESAQGQQAALAALESPDPALRVEAAGVLGRAGLFHLRRIASATDASPGLRAAAYQRMTPLMSAEEIERALLENFDRLPLEGRRAVVESAFSQLNPDLEISFPGIFARMRTDRQLELLALIEKVRTSPAGWFIRGLLQSPRARVRAAAIVALANRGERADLTLILAETEEDDSKEVRSAREYARARLAKKRAGAGALSLVDSAGGLSEVSDHGALYLVEDPPPEDEGSGPEPQD